MWYYEKRLEYPVKISTPNAKIAQIILSQYGGYRRGKRALLCAISRQRFSAPNRITAAVLTEMFSYGRAGPSGNDRHHCSSADPESFRRGTGKSRVCALLRRPYHWNLAGGPAGGYPFSAAEFQYNRRPYHRPE